MSTLKMKALFAIVLLAMGLAASLIGGSPAHAAKPAVYTELVKGVGAGGYDVVAYFSQKKPVVGDKEITHSYNGAIWRFSSEENRDTFAANPEKYAPQYGGYCAWAVSRGYTAKGDPNAWSIFNGKLYLNFDKSVRATWARNKAANVVKADKNWPDVLQ